VMRMTLEFVLPVRTLMMQFNLFADDHMLLNASYAVRAPVSVDEFLQFVLLLSEKMLKSRTPTTGLSLLCDEFRFGNLSEPLTAFQQSIDLKAAMEDLKVRGSSVRPWRSGSCSATAYLRRCAKHRNQLQRRSRTRSFDCPRSRHKVHADKLRLFELRRQLHPFRIRPPPQRPISLHRSVQR
jgi:hypothetical protein